MKLAIDDTFESNGLRETTEFKLKASPMAFKILSDGLYRDKVGAVVRELACNAYDAHVAAGTTDTPFYIHAPSYLEPYFVIRDYGIGLSEEDVLNLYTTYFESTKSTSNEFIGALGLGSKSPFSYTNNFNVTSYFNGTQYDFCVFLDSRGMPTISKLNDEPSEEANGLKITIQMNNSSSDIQQFKYAMKRYLSVFNNIDVAGMDISKLQIVEEFKTCKVLKDENRYTMPLFTIKQGHVLYPLDMDMLKIDSSVVDFELKEYRTFLIEAPIGTCSITASREELGYDDDTIQYLKSRVDEIVAEIHELVQTAYDVAESMHPDDIFSSTQQFQELLIETIKLPVIENVKIIKSDLSIATVKQVLSYYIDQKAVRFKHLKWRKVNHKREVVHSIPCTKQTSMYITLPYDKPTIPASCIQEFYEKYENEDIKLYFIKDHEMLPVIRKYAITVADFKAQYTPPRQIKIKISTIKAAVQRDAGDVYLKTLGCSDYGKVEVADLKDCYWLPYNYVSGDIASNLLRICNELKAQKLLDDKPVYMLNQDNIKLYASEMIKFEDAIFSKLKAIESLELESYICDVKHRRFSGLANTFDIVNHIDIIKLFPKLQKYVNAKDRFYNTSIALLLAFFPTLKYDVAAIDTKKASIKDEFKNQLESINSRFPMLALLSTYTTSLSDKDIETLVDYINDVLSKEMLQLENKMNEEEEEYVKVS